MNVLFVTHSVVMGGANRSLLQLMLELRQNHGITPILLMPHIKDKKLTIREKCEENDIQCISSRFYSFKGKPSVISCAKYTLNIFLIILVLIRLRNVKFDLVHTNSSVIDIGVIVSRIRCVKHIWHLREFGELDFGLKSLFGKTYEKLVYKGGNKFIAISNVVKKEYSKVISQDKIEVIYNGIDEKKIAKTERHDEGILQICMVGAVQSAKNQLEGIKAIEHCVNEGIFNVHLTIIGRLYPPYSDTLQDYVKRKNLTKYIHFYGESDNVSELLSKMDIGLTLSVNEAFGRVTVEYMLHGLTVIASDTGANGELIKNGVTGFLYSLGDVNELTDIIRKLLEDRYLMHQVSEQGRNFALKNFRSIQNSSKISCLYSEIHTV